MIINQLTAIAQWFLPAQEFGIDELSINFDLALSPELVALLSLQNETVSQPKPEHTAAVLKFALDEHELALA